MEQSLTIESEAPVSPGEVFSALASPDRRLLLVVLRDREGSERLSMLARTLAGETGRSSDGAINRTRARLYHVHVPKLAEAGIVSNDEERGIVGLTDYGRALAESLTR